MNVMQSQSIACPICGSQDTTLHRSDVLDFEYKVQPAQSYAFRACRSCASYFLYPRPENAEIATFYPSDYHAYHDDHEGIARFLVVMRSKARARFYQNLIGSEGGALFDVGTGDCRHFDALKPYCSLSFAGVEIKPEIAERARARGYDVTTGTLETMDLARHLGKYDIVSMNHVLEHVLEPEEMLRRSFALLKPGGLVIGQLPARDCWEEAIFGRYWGGYHFPRHLQAFSYGAMRGILERVGFTNVKVSAAPHVQSALSLQNFLIGRGWQPAMKYGKSPLYSWFILAVLPFEFFAWLGGRGGVMNFIARKPAL